MTCSVCLETLWNITGAKICWPTMDWCTVWNKKDCSDLNENGFSWIVNRFQFQALVPFSGFYSSIFLPHDPEIWLYIIIANAKMQTLMLLGNLFVVGSVCDDLWCNIARWSNSFFHSHFIINSTGLGKQRDIMDIRDRHGSKQFEQFKETGSKNCKLGTIPKSIRTARSPWRTTFSAFTSLVTLSKTKFEALKRAVAEHIWGKPSWVKQAGNLSESVRHGLGKIRPMIRQNDVRGLAKFLCERSCWRALATGNVTERKKNSKSHWNRSAVIWDHLQSNTASCLLSIRSPLFPSFIWRGTNRSMQRTSPPWSA